MKNETTESLGADPTWSWLLTVAVMSLLGFFSGCDYGSLRVQREAVQQKQAHYTVDNEGKTTFVWGAKK